MPPYANFERLIGMAIVDSEFRTALLASPVSAAESLGLTSDELEVLASARRGSLEELAGYIYSRLSSLPRSYRGHQRRWAADSPQGARIAV